MDPDLLSRSRRIRMLMIGLLPFNRLRGKALRSRSCGSFCFRLGSDVCRLVRLGLDRVGMGRSRRGLTPWLRRLLRRQVVQLLYSRPD